MSRFGKFFILFLQVVLLPGCYTMMEGLDPTSYNVGRGSFKNAQGETVQKYTTVHESSMWNVPLLTGVDRVTDNTFPARPSYSQPAIEPDVFGASDYRAYLDVSGSGEDLHLGLHAGFRPTRLTLMRFGMSMITSHDLYLGLDLSGRYFISESEFTPFAGAGAFLGDSRYCTISSSNSEECEKKILGLGYLEAGLKWSKISIFYRTYSINRAGISIPARDFYGVGIEF